MRQLDGTVAFDDEFTARHRTCVLCGARSTVVEVSVRVVHGLVVCASTCLRCRKDEPAVLRVLEARYAEG